MTGYKEFLDYLSSQARAAYNLAWERTALIFGAVWHELQSRFAGFWFTAPLFWLSIFWLIDFVLGSIRAQIAGEWRARRALMSGVKLAAGCCVLLVAHAIRDSKMIGLGLASSLLDTVVLFAEFSSVLIHAGELSGIEVFSKIGRAFRSGSNRAADKFTEILDPENKEEEEHVKRSEPTL